MNTERDYIKNRAHRELMKALALGKVQESAREVIVPDKWNIKEKRVEQLESIAKSNYTAKGIVQGLLELDPELTKEEAEKMIADYSSRRKDIVNKFFYRNVDAVEYVSNLLMIRHRVSTYNETNQQNITTLKVDRDLGTYSNIKNPPKYAEYETDSYTFDSKRYEDFIQRKIYSDKTISNLERYFVLTRKMYREHKIYILPILAEFIGNEKASAILHISTKTRILGESPIVTLYKRNTGKSTFSEKTKTKIRLNLKQVFYYEKKQTLGHYVAYVPNKYKAQADLKFLAKYGIVLNGTTVFDSFANLAKASDDTEEEPLLETTQSRIL